MSAPNMIANSDAPEARIFQIPSPNMPSFQAKLAKLAKRAGKLGCEVPSYTLIKEETKVIQVVVGKETDDYGITREIIGDKLIMVYHIAMNGGKVVVAGHEFCCTIEHMEEGNILHTLKGKVVDPKYRSCKPWCDHCKTMRRRLDTFVVRHIESNTYLQVGRNCLADFLGRDAANLAAVAELWYEIDELASASESEGGSRWGNAGEWFDLLDTYLSYVAECIARDGWRSRSTAKEYGSQATADFAYWVMHPSKEDIRENKLPFRTPSDKSIEIAKEAIAWCEALPDNEVEASDYLHNIRLIARRSVVGGRQYGFAASIVSGYQRHLGTLKRKASFADQAKVSSYVGVVGERGKFLLTIDHVVTLPDYGYGASHLHLMYDAEGNRYTWKTGSSLEVGKEYTLSGIVKAHEEYKGVKQTTLTRCKEVEFHTYTCCIGGTIHEGKAEDEKEFRKELLSRLALTRMPKGAKIELKVG